MLDSLIRIIKLPAMGAMRPGRVEIAAAALLAETARGQRLSENEAAAIAEIIRGRFLLSLPAAEALVSLAERCEDESYREGTFAETVKAAFDADERRKLLAHLRLVAATDAVLSRSETLIPHLASRLGLGEGALPALSQPGPARRRSATR